MRFVAILFVAILWCAPVWAGGYDIIVILGQSNAKESGLGPYHDPYQSPETDSRIVQLGRYADDLKVVPLGCEGGYNNLHHWNGGCQQGYGFAVPFARRYVANHLAPGRKVLLVPAARGATSILEWSGEIIRWPESPLLYSDMIGRVRYALTLPDSRIASVNIALGETDSALCRAGAYGMSQMAFRDRYRDFLLAGIRSAFPGQYPIIAQKFVPSWHEGDTCKAQIETEIQTAVNFDPMYHFVPTTGLQSNTDIGEGDSEVHFSAASMVILGIRHYARWLLMMGQPNGVISNRRRH